MKTTDRLRRAGPATGMAAAGPGRRAEVTIVRAGQAHTVPVTLGTLPAG